MANEIIRKILTFTRPKKVQITLTGSIGGSFGLGFFFFALDCSSAVLKFASRIQGYAKVNGGTFSWIHPQSEKFNGGTFFGFFRIQGYFWGGVRSISAKSSVPVCKRGYAAILLTLVEYRYSKVGVRCVSGVKRFSNHLATFVQWTPAITKRSNRPKSTVFTAQGPGHLLKLTIFQTSVVPGTD